MRYQAASFSNSFGDERGASGQERVDVLLALADGEGDVDACCLGALRQPGGVVEKRLDASRRDVEPGETGEVGVQRVGQRSLRVNGVAEDAGDHAFEQFRGDQGVGVVVGDQGLALVLHVEPRGERDDAAGARLALRFEGQGDGDGEVAACGITDGGDVLRRDAGGDERFERGHTVLELGRVAELGGAPVVQHEADGAEGLGDVGGELAVAGGRADGESAAVGVEEHLGLVRSLRQAPDARDSADGVLAVRHTLRFDGGLVPFVEQRSAAGGW